MAIRATINIGDLVAMAITSGDLAYMVHQLALGF